MTENDRVLGPQKVGEEGKSPYFRENIGWWNNIIWPDEMFGLLCAFCNKLWLWHSLMSLMSILPRSKHDELRQQRCFFFWGGGWWLIWWCFEHYEKVGQTWNMLMKILDDHTTSARQILLQCFTAIMPSWHLPQWSSWGRKKTQGE